MGFILFLFLKKDSAHTLLSRLTFLGRLPLCLKYQSRTNLFKAAEQRTHILGLNYLMDYVRDDIGLGGIWRETKKPCTHNIDVLDQLLCWCDNPFSKQLVTYVSMRCQAESSALSFDFHKLLRKRSDSEAAKLSHICTDRQLLTLSAFCRRYLKVSVYELFGDNSDERVTQKNVKKKKQPSAENIMNWNTNRKKWVTIFHIYDNRFSFSHRVVITHLPANFAPMSLADQDNFR